VIGCTVAIFVSLPKSVIAAIMAFGSGVLIAALTFSLVEEAFSLSQSILPVVIGFILGGVSYSVANHILESPSQNQVLTPLQALPMIVVTVIEAAQFEKERDLMARMLVVGNQHLD
jgi:zinc transporter ZupT